MPKKIEASDADWKADFESVRIQQMLDFRALPLREKFQAMEDMAKVVEAARKARERQRKSSGSET